MTGADDYPCFALWIRVVTRSALSSNNSSKPVVRASSPLSIKARNRSVLVWHGKAMDDTSERS